MKTSRLADVNSLAQSLNKTQEVKRIFEKPEFAPVQASMDFGAAVDSLHDLLHEKYYDGDYSS